MLDGASHMVMMERPDEVNRLIHNFLLQDLHLSESAQQGAATAITAHASSQHDNPAEQTLPSGVKSPSPSPPLSPVINKDSLKRRRASRSISKGMGSTVSLKSVKSIPANLMMSNIIS